MNTYKIVYKDGKTIIVKADRAIEVIRKYDLVTKENLGYTLYQLWIHQKDT